MQIRSVVAITVFLAVLSLVSPVFSQNAARKQPAVPALEQKRFPQGTLYTLKIPPGSGFQVRPLLSPNLALVNAPGWSVKTPKKPVFVLNGGFFDPANGQTTSFIQQNGMLTADPRVNPKLIGNPKLKPYLPQIFNRPEFRTYICRSASGQFKLRYDIVHHPDPIPPDCLLRDALGAGPTLLPTMQDREEAFTDYSPEGKRIRDPIGVCARNARSAVGLTEDGSVVLVMGAQEPSKPAGSGFTLSEMAALLKARGAVKAMALDGGSSSSLVYRDKVYFGKVNKDGTLVKRPVKSVLAVIQE